IAATSTIFLATSGNVGIGTTTPSQKVAIHGVAPQIHFYDVNQNRAAFFGITDAFNAVIDTAGGGVPILKSSGTTYLTIGSSGNSYFNNGNVGIGTTTPFRKLSLTDAVSTAQTAIAYDATRYTDLLTDASGDFVINPSGNDTYFNDDNLWVCAGGACPGSMSGTGNLMVEGSLYVSTGNTSGGGIEFADDADIVDLNDGYVSVRPSLGMRVTDALGAGSTVIQLSNGSGAPTYFNSSNNVGIGTTTPVQQLSVANNLYIGNGGVTSMGQATSTFQGDIKILGKLDVGTIDPVYTIGGVKYATYGASTIGIREEVVTNIKVDTRVASGEFEYILDFNTLPKGSDLWLFYQITALGDAWDGLVVSLTPSFAGSVHYKKDVEAGRLIITASETGEVGVRLSAPRYDAQKWSNLRPDQEDPFTHHELEEKQ
ncbi:MAG: hypothetical protein KBE09_05785, partial [Candidatus Pacebacteria bacterium]|nr:hypothetical protein [Candidatus Paceibacterota bacterium]